MFRRTQMYQQGMCHIFCLLGLRLSDPFFGSSVHVDVLKLQNYKKMDSHRGMDMHDHAPYMKISPLTKIEKKKHALHGMKKLG